MCCSTGPEGLIGPIGENSFNGTLNGINASLANFTHDSLGWVAGGGIEWMFWYGCSTKAEYLYLQNNSSNSTIPVSAAFGALAAPARQYIGPWLETMSRA